MYELIVGEIGVSIFALLLEIWQIGVVVDSLVEIVDLLVGEHSGWVFEELMVVVEAELSFSVVEFVGVAVVMTFQGLISSLIAAGGGSQRGGQQIVSAFCDHTRLFIVTFFIL